MSNIDKHIDKQAVQAVADLKAGYTLGHADVAILNELARIALASLEAEAVGYVDAEYAELLKSGHIESCFVYAEQGEGCIAVYTAPPAPVSVPDEMEPTVEAIKRVLPTSNPDEYAACIGADMWNACRSAMLQWAENAESTTTMQTAPALDSSPKIAESPSGNSPVIPDGWVMVPVDATRAMIDAAARVEEDGYDAMHKAMIAAAPPQ